MQRVYHYAHTIFPNDVENNDNNNNEKGRGDDDAGAVVVECNNIAGACRIQGSHCPHCQGRIEPRTLYDDVDVDDDVNTTISISLSFTNTLFYKII